MLKTRNNGTSPVPGGQRQQKTRTVKKKAEKHGRDAETRRNKKGNLPGGKGRG